MRTCVLLTPANDRLVEIRQHLRSAGCTERRLPCPTGLRGSWFELGRIGANPGAGSVLEALTEADTRSISAKALPALVGSAAGVGEAIARRLGIEVLVAHLEDGKCTHLVIWRGRSVMGVYLAEPTPYWLVDRWERDASRPLRDVVSHVLVGMRAPDARTGRDLGLRISVWLEKLPQSVLNYLGLALLIGVVSVGHVIGDAAGYPDLGVGVAFCAMVAVLWRYG